MSRGYLKYFCSRARLDCRSRESRVSGMVKAIGVEEKQVDGDDRGDYCEDDATMGDDGGGGTR